MMELNICVNALRIIANGVQAKDWQSARHIACDALEAIDSASTKPQINIIDLLGAVTKFQSESIDSKFGLVIATQHFIQWFFNRGVDLTCPIEPRPKDKPKRKRL